MKFSNFTPEEIEEDKRDILEMSKSGVPIAQMRADLGRSREYIQKIRKELIASGQITEREMQEALNRYQSKQNELKRQKQQSVNRDDESLLEERGEVEKRIFS